MYVATIKSSIYSRIQRRRLRPSLYYVIGGSIRTSNIERRLRHHCKPGILHATWLLTQEVYMANANSNLWIIPAGYPPVQSYSQELVYVMSSIYQYYALFRDSGGVRIHHWTPKCSSCFNEFDKDDFLAYERSICNF